MGILADLFCIAIASFKVGLASASRAANTL